MTDDEELQEQRAWVDEITGDIEAVEASIAAVKDEREAASVMVARALDTALGAYQKQLKDLIEQRNERSEYVSGMEAMYSPLGRLADAAFKRVQFDYMSTEDYPGVVDEMQAVLDKLGLDIVPRG